MLTLGFAIQTALSVKRGSQTGSSPVSSDVRMFPRVRVYLNSGPASAKLDAA